MSSTVHLLLVEDDLEDVAIIKKLLVESSRAEFVVVSVGSLEEAESALSAVSFEVVLLDLGLPGTQGLESLTRIQSLKLPVPIVIIAERNDEELALRSLKNGAQDYLVKSGLTTDNLVRSIHHATERYRLVQHVAESQTLLKSKNLRLKKLYNTAHKFVDNVSHEFRTPLTVIKEYVSLIKDGVAGEISTEQRKMLTVVEDRADDLNTMVDDMLDVSRLEAGLLGVYRKVCQATDIMAYVRPAIERKAATRNVKLEWEIEEDLPTLYCDAEKAGRVLINLTVNAIKFCGQPGQVRLSCRRQPNAKGVEFSITDNGPGITTKDQKSLFRRFEQLSNSTRSSTKGFGLGLSIAKELVEANLGEISLDSDASRGSTFSFTLPSADSAEVMRCYLHRLAHLHNGPACVSVLRVDIAATEAVQPMENVDSFLSCLLRYNDLLLHVGEKCRLIVLPVPEGEVNAFCQRAEKAITDASRNCFGDPFPRIDFEFVASWDVSDHQGILNKLLEVAHSEEVSYV
ncbi:MAG: hybrid sensor histidine kinase/response regulator [Planctomycetota bacterium]|nr:hybrid sensor histidine kinase/response regulator [Planctomycetota bacterium]